MGYIDKFDQGSDIRREELLRKLSACLEQLTLEELEALYYDMTTKNYIHERE